MTANLSVVSEPEPVVFDIDDVSLMDMIDIETEFEIPFTEMKQGHLMAALAWLDARKSNPGVHWQEVARTTRMSGIRMSGGDDASPKAITTTEPQT